MPMLHFQPPLCEPVCTNAPVVLATVTPTATVAPKMPLHTLEPISERKVDSEKKPISQSHTKPQTLSSTVKNTLPIGLSREDPSTAPMPHLTSNSSNPPALAPIPAPISAPAPLHRSFKKTNKIATHIPPKQHPLTQRSALQSEIQHQLNRLRYFHTRPPVYIAHPSFELEDFKLLDTLGTGTFGRVYLTKLNETNKFYAMKVLKKSEVIRLKQLEHVMFEKNILASVRFPFVVDLFCVYQDNANLYMLLEYVVGGELFTHLRKAGRFTNDMTRFYASEIVLAIEYLHSKNIIYRDLKPENLLVDHQGHIKMTDFGFAKTVEEHTWTWTLCGTPEYLAPEIIQGKGHDKAVDWWALGILIFEMLAGYPPFFGENSFEIYEKILANKVQYPSHFDLLAKDLLKRFLISDRNKRLGNLQSGSEDIKRHKWFRGVDWIGLLEKNVQAPIIPNYHHPGDTSNFEKYLELKEDPKTNKEDQYKDLFLDF